MAEGYRIEKNVIVINRNLNELDLFVKDFLKILKNHCKYLIVSGYVSISTGRIRGTEDVDVLIPKLSKEKFKNLYDDLIKNNFWCYQGDNSEIIYEYIENLNNIRFAKNKEIFPNIEVIPIDETRRLKMIEFNNPQKIRIETFEFLIPPIEFEILYKEIVLASKKDLEDAKHLRTFFSNFINEKKINKYKEIIKMYEK